MVLSLVIHYQIVKGEGTVTLKKEDITQIFQNILDLVGSSLFVAVSVLTESGKKDRKTCVHVSVSFSAC